MAKPPPPPAFNPDGTPKGHRATVAGHDSAREYAVEAVRRSIPHGDHAAGTGTPTEFGDRTRNATPVHDSKPSANPATPDVDVLHSKHVTPDQATPLRDKRGESGKLKAGVESHARYEAIGDTTLFDDSLTRFSDNTTILVSALVVLYATLGLLMFGLFGGGWVIALGIGAALVLGVLALLFYNETLSGMALLITALVLVGLAALGMWLLNDPTTAFEQRTLQTDAAIDASTTAD